MSKNNIVQVFEYSKLRHADTSHFKKRHFDAMVAFNERNGNKYYTVIHNGILFNSYVGVIQIGGLTIEILPKADKNDGKQVKKTWQNVLLNMLKVCKHIQVDAISEANLSRKQNSILEIYFEIFLQEIENLIKNGLIKKYKRVQENQFALKGKLVFSKNIIKNLTHQERFFCEHETYTKDHIIHQILFKTLKQLCTIAPPHLLDRIIRAKHIFNDCKSITITEQVFDRLKLDRKSSPYRKSLDIAKMFLFNYSPNLNSGKENMLTLLFDMNLLWEEYVHRLLVKYNNHGYKINPQTPKYFWNNKTVRPDIILEKNGEVIIIDTKWKIIESNAPSDDDLKQMFTYNLLFQAKKSILLYPKINQSDGDFGAYNYRDYQQERTYCRTAFVNLVTETGTIMDGKDIAVRCL